jgi:hypothetical protein
MLYKRGQAVEDFDLPLRTIRLRIIRRAGCQSRELGAES